MNFLKLCLLALIFPITGHAQNFFFFQAEDGIRDTNS